LQLQQESLAEELLGHLSDLEHSLDDVEVVIFLNGPFDRSNAFLHIHAGQGGKEACAWAAMLVRMYLRWADQPGFKGRALEALMDESGGCKSAVLEISGPFAFGRLQGEKGVHRLSRVSPFDHNGRRQTSFASVEVCPEAEEESPIEVKEGDLTLEFYRCGGSGGQNVNKVNTAVRMRHLPSGIVVACQMERTQNANRTNALRILKSRLLRRRLEEKAAQATQEHQAKKPIGWGHHIRSYIVNPQTMVIDHRTHHKTPNLDGVLNGGLDTLLRTYICHQKAA